MFHWQVLIRFNKNCKLSGSSFLFSTTLYSNHLEYTPLSCVISTTTYFLLSYCSILTLPQRSCHVHTQTTYLKTNLVAKMCLPRNIVGLSSLHRRNSSIAVFTNHTLTQILAINSRCRQRRLTIASINKQEVCGDQPFFASHMFVGIVSSLIYSERCHMSQEHLFIRNNRPVFGVAWQITDAWQLVVTDKKKRFSHRQ